MLSCPIRLVSALILSCAAVAAAAAGKPSVLYVGTDPARNPAAVEMMAGRDDRLKQLYAGRMSAFKTLLEKNFDKVAVVDAGTYTPEMSNLYDVTIFDALPPELPLKPGRMNSRTGGPLRAYLPRNFSRPAILIGVNGAELGDFLGLKINMHCPCLDAHAHGMKMEHEIFNTPNRVELTLEQVKTPGNYRKYYSGRSLGETLPLWRVQTEGYKDRKGMPAGLVATGPGFEDSPDAEIISSGVNTKAVNSVALARHGNYFMWGFWADPSYMTEEAKQVFVNAVHYIRKFDQPPFVRADGYKLSRDFLLDHISAQLHVDMRQRYQDQLKYPEARRSNSETEFLASVFSVPREVAERIGFNTQGYLDYQLHNLGYLGEVPGTTVSRYREDPDVRTIGIPNWDVRMLEACVSMLERNERTDLAQRLLVRYTDQTFTSAARWRQWLVSNRGKLFFTDLGGFKFLAYPTEVKPAPRITEPAAQQHAYQIFAQARRSQYQWQRMPHATEAEKSARDADRRRSEDALAAAAGDFLAAYPHDPRKWEVLAALICAERSFTGPTARADELAWKVFCDDTQKRLLNAEGVPLAVWDRAMTGEIMRERTAAEAQRKKGEKVDLSRWRAALTG